VITYKDNIVRDLVAGDNNIFVMEERQAFSNNWIFKYRYIFKKTGVYVEKLLPPQLEMSAPCVISRINYQLEFGYVRI
jgi:hypothetical protein